ncbi:amidohydrolase [Natronoarchaeum mannanilyticum]|uniref:amidohydrolase n=1 Tax=Natronoarchaeum mannanilyticum TaxID=926360 RepID=UPI0036065B2B
MTEAADLLLTGAEVHALTDPDRTAEAVAVRDGEIVRVGPEYEVRFLEGVETDVIELDGGVVLPGFIDAHTHVQLLGQYELHADLWGIESRGECLDALRDHAAELDAESEDADSPSDDWVVGFRYDESAWDADRPLTREDLDAVSEDRPVAVFRIDVHSASLNGAALERLRDDLPESDVRTESGDPTGVIVEDALDVLWEHVAPDREDARELLVAAQERAHRLGVTGVHDMVRNTTLPWAYRALDREDCLRLRVRLNYWADHLDAVSEAGLAPGAGSEFVRTGAIKSYTDGAIGSHTARLGEPYDDNPEEHGQWVIEPDELREIVADAAASDFPVAAHAIGDAAIDAALDAFENADAALEDPNRRYRIEHAELADDEQIDRMAAAGVVASAQPNFLQWAGEGGLYDRRLGVERRKRADRFRGWLDAGVPVAFGSDCMPMDPLYGVDQAVNAPTDAQRISVTEALRAYTYGGAFAAGDEDRLGTIEVGKTADLVALERSPWEHSEAIDEIGVALTVVDGDVVYGG